MWRSDGQTVFYKGHPIATIDPARAARALEQAGYSPRVATAIALGALRKPETTRELAKARGLLR